MCDQREPYSRIRASDEIGATYERGEQPSQHQGIPCHLPDYFVPREWRDKKSMLHPYGKYYYGCLSSHIPHDAWKSIATAESPTRRYTAHSTIGHVPTRRLTTLRFLSTYQPIPTSHQFSAPMSTRTYAKRWIPQNLLKTLDIEKKGKRYTNILIVRISVKVSKTE